MQLTSLSCHQLIYLRLNAFIYSYSGTRELLLIICQAKHAMYEPFLLYSPVLSKVFPHGIRDTDPGIGEATKHMFVPAESGVYVYLAVC